MSNTLLNSFEENNLLQMIDILVHMLILISYIYFIICKFGPDFAS